MDSTINVLLSTFPGLDLPPTVCLTCPSQLTTQDLLSQISNLVPQNVLSHLYVTSTDNRKLSPSKVTTLAQFVGSLHPSCASTTIIPLHLRVPLVGGKGGFGSQLRAAGGRMSSRKKKQNAELATGSARNLDGRRLRTIKEAKNLATYLATKPEMDRRQKEEQRQRWEQVIELAEQREADMRAGKGADGRRRGLSEAWIEEKDEVTENVKNAVKIAMAAEAGSEKLNGSDSDRSRDVSEENDSEDDDPMVLDEDDMNKLTREAESGDTDALWVLKNRLKIPTSMLPKQKQQRHFAGFDDEDEDEDDGNDDDASQPPHGDLDEQVSDPTEKGKAPER